MKALTLTQPWATLVALGEKKIETRSWTTRYTGPLAIHAAKSFPDWAMELATSYEVFTRALQRHGLSAHQLPRGVVLATCRLKDALPTTSLLAPGLATREWAFGDCSPGRFMFRLEDVVPLERPVPARGSLGLWEWEP